MSVTPTTAFLTHITHPKKWALQEQYYKLASTFIKGGEGGVIDLPSIYLEESISRMKLCNLEFSHYVAFEWDKNVMSILRSLRKELTGPKITLHSGDILSVLNSSYPRTTLCREPVKLFNFDFCDAITPPHRIFMIPTAVNRYMADRAAVLVTFSIRSKDNYKRLDYSMSKIMGDLFNVKLVDRVSSTYCDSTTMYSNIYLLERV